MTRPFSSFYLLPFLIAALTLTGCGTTGGPASASFASVIIEKKTPAEIQAATGKVFREDGYVGAALSPTRMVFEKEASRLTTISRDGFIAAQGGASTIERVKTELVDLGEGTYRLQCEAFMVSQAGDSFFENEVRKTNFRSGPYRSLMRKVGKELKSAGK